MKLLWQLFKISYTILLLILFAFCIGSLFIPSLNEWIEPSGMEEFEGHILGLIVPYMYPAWFFLLTLCYPFIFGKRQADE